MKNMTYSVKKRKKVIGKYKIETPKNYWIEEIVCLWCKMYSFECGDDLKKIKIISKSQSKHVKLKSIKKV